MPAGQHHGLETAVGAPLRAGMVTPRHRLPVEGQGPGVLGTMVQPDRTRRYQERVGRLVGVDSLVVNHGWSTGRAGGIGAAGIRPIRRIGA